MKVLKLFHVCIFTHKPKPCLNVDIHFRLHLESRDIQAACPENARRVEAFDADLLRKGGRYRSIHRPSVIHTHKLNRPLVLIVNDKVDRTVHLF